MATKPETFPVECYLVPPGIPGQHAPKPTLMRPSPMTEYVGRWGRRKELEDVKKRVASSPMVSDSGHSITGVNWGEKKDGTRILVVYLRQGTSLPPAKPIVPEVAGRRTAVSRRHTKSQKRR